jgi:hypothetical protein
MYKSRIEQKGFNRRFFNPSDKKDIRDFRYFMANGKWAGYQCPFFLIWPYLTIPDMIKDQFTKYTLGIEESHVDKR